MTPNKAKLIDGKDFSNQLIRSLIPDIKTILKIIGRPPTLAVILVGEDGASQVYVRNKVKQTEAAGMVSVEHRLSDQTDEETLLSLVETLNNDDEIDGILVQLPLPKHINEHCYTGYQSGQGCRWVSCHKCGEINDWTKRISALYSAWLSFVVA